MYERFTDRARKVMQLANQEAQRLNHDYIGTPHILLGIIKDGAGLGAGVLSKLRLDLRKVRGEMEKVVPAGSSRWTPGKLPQTPQAQMVVAHAIEEARNLNHDWVGTGHLLLGLLRDQEGVAGDLLVRLRIKLDCLRKQVLEGLKNSSFSAESGFGPSESSHLAKRLEVVERRQRELRLIVGAMMGTLVGACVGATFGSGDAAVMGAVLGTGLFSLIGPVVERTRYT